MLPCSLLLVLLPTLTLGYGTRLPHSNEMIKVVEVVCPIPFRKIYPLFKSSNPMLMTVSLKSCKWPSIKAKKSRDLSPSHYITLVSQKEDGQRQKKKSSQSNTKAFWYLEAKGTEDANFMPECRCNLILPFTETKDIWSHTEETWDPKLTRGINPIQMGPGKSSQVSCLWCSQVCLLRLSTLSYRFWAYLQKNIQNRKTKHKYRKLTSWLKVLQSGGPSGLWGSWRTPKCYDQSHRVPPKNKETEFHV